MKTDLDQAKNILVKNQLDLRQKYSVKTLGIFGSTALGQNKSSSDIDILVEFSKPIGMFAFLELEEYLSQILSKKVDLVSKKALKLAIKDEVLEQVNYV